MPHYDPNATITQVLTRILNVRQALSRDGHDAETIDQAVVFAAVALMHNEHELSATAIHETVEEILKALQTAPQEAH